MSVIDLITDFETQSDCVAGMKGVFQINRKAAFGPGAEVGGEAVTGPQRGAVAARWGLSAASDGPCPQDVVYCPVRT
jgi:hypothetical protein